MTDQPHAALPAPVPGTASSRPVPGPPPAAVTGEPRVDRALALLQTLGDGDLASQVDAFSEVHRLLQDALATLDGA